VGLRGASITRSAGSRSGGNLAASHRHLVAQHERLDVLGRAVSGESGQHLQNLAQQHVHE
jgi:hypothetical protein